MYLSIYYLPMGEEIFAQKNTPKNEGSQTIALQ